MSKRIKFDQTFEESLAKTEQREEKEAESSDEDYSSSESVDEKLPVLRSIVEKGKVSVEASSRTEEDINREAIKQELSTLSFEELQKLKEQIGSKKFQKTLNGPKQEKQVRDFKRANPNRPREMSSKVRPTQPKSVFQIPKTFRNDPRYDKMCGDYNEQVL